MAVVLHGMKLDEFLAEWDRVLIHIQEPPAQDVKDCPKLKTEWDNYYKSSDPTIICFKYLYDSAQLVVQRERFEAASSMRPSGKAAAYGGTDAMAATDK
eukprot:12842170-Heterocapsa_arctica.AAC.1